jgi:hypothetical protein
MTNGETGDGDGGDGAMYHSATKNGTVFSSWVGETRRSKKLPLFPPVTEQAS